MGAVSGPDSVGDVAAFLAGAPATGRGLDPAPDLVAAERAIASLRLLLGAAAADAGGVLRIALVRDPAQHLAQVRIWADGDAVVVELPPAVAPPADQGAPTSVQDRAGARARARADRVKADHAARPPAP